MSGRDRMIEEAAKLDVGSYAGVEIGELVGMADNGRIPMVMFRGQPSTSAVPARTTVDLHGAHIGREVVLMFEEADPEKPIIMGVLRIQAAWPLTDVPGQVEVEADGERLLVSAKRQLVLSCGSASITMTSSGKVLIKGEYISSCANGLNRIGGGSVQIN